jgi:hypothetical protein
MQVNQKTPNLLLQQQQQQQQQMGRQTKSRTKGRRRVWDS